MTVVAISENGRDASDLQERRLDRTILRTFRTTAALDDILPNPKQPRLGPKEDAELQRQIEANEGLFEPLLVEPHPEFSGKYQIIDGDRRWTNCRLLVDHGREQYSHVPVEVTDRILSEDERLRAWIYIHRQRKEWDAKEKEMVAYRLVDLMGRASCSEHPWNHGTGTGQVGGNLRSLRAFHFAPGSKCSHHVGSRTDER